MSEQLAVFEQNQQLGFNAAAETEQQRAIAETQMAMMMAVRFPRDEKKAIQRILTACER